SLISFWIMLLVLLVDLSSVSSTASSDAIDSYHDDDVTRAALSHYIFKRRLGVRLPNILRISDHPMTKRRLGVRLPNILFQRDGSVVAKKADDDF
ncbi:hypothetical protein PENTCL1PPCAC_25650, partial [Pristionchus entomophagus]